MATEPAATETTANETLWAGVQAHPVQLRKDQTNTNTGNEHKG